MYKLKSRVSIDTPASIGYPHVMIPRTLGKRLKELAGPYPVVFLTGPRQSGKTTLARNTFPGFEYRSLENLQTREEAIEDPLGFLGLFEGGGGVILDEVQRAPDLFSYLQGFVDEDRGGPFVLTGSQQFLLSEKISQSLAGRAAVLELMPFSMAELEGRKPRGPEEILRGRGKRKAQTGPELDEALFTGFFPRIHDKGLAPRTWLDGYVRTYVERDVRTVSGVGDLDAFSRFLGLCAGRAGALVNTSGLGSDAGVSHVTAKRWLSILRASYIVDFLVPHHRNFNKRLVRSPKLYFVDTGLLCYLLGIRSPADLRDHPLRGPIFENYVVAEFRKLFLHGGESPPLFFWRDSHGREVDLLIDLGKRRIPVEVKSGRTVASDFFRGLDFYTGLSGDEGGMLVYGGDESYQRKNHAVRSWRECT